MAKAKKKEVQEENLELVEGALSKTEQFIEDNSKSISIAIGVIIAIVGIYMAYQKFYILPQQQEANEYIFQAENYFEQDSFNLALNGDGNNFGFLDIIDQYGSTKTGNLAYYYAGICYLQLGDFQNAIDYLSKFDADDETLYPMSQGAIGDAYNELGEVDKAIDQYLKAGSVKNDFTAPLYLMKAGLLLEKQSNFSKALSIYQQIKKDYSSSDEARYIEKYIQRAESNM